MAYQYLTNKDIKVALLLQTKCYGFVFLEECFKIPVEKMNMKKYIQNEEGHAAKACVCFYVTDSANADCSLFPIHVPRDLVISNQTPPRPQTSNRKATTKSKEKLHQSSHLGNIQRSRNPAKHTHAAKKESRPAVMLPKKLERTGKTNGFIGAKDQNNSMEREIRYANASGF